MNDEKLKYMANFIAAWAFEHLISTTGIDRLAARRAAVNAGNKAVQSLAQDLRGSDDV